MKRRIICLLLSAAILLGAGCLTVSNVSAASAMKASGDIVALIKSFEGFSEKPYFDYGHWSVGYGTACEEGDYPDGITEAEAEELLQKYIASFEKSLNKFIDKYNLKLKQCQFDALLDFTYNLGTNWMSDPDQVFTSAVINGATGNDFIFAITRWCTVSQNGQREIRLSLVNRRLVEANMYLNGVYGENAPSNYQYVIFDNNIDFCVNDVRIQGYDNTVTDGLRAAPTKSGYRFLGWYTKAEGGEWTTSVGTDTLVNTLFGHWQEGNGATDEKGNVTGTAASYHRYALADTVVRETPNDSGAETAKLSENDLIEVVADHMDENNVKWAKRAAGGWVKLAETLPAKKEAPETDNTMKPVTVHVLRNGVNIRSGPGTNYQKLGTYTKGQELVITEVQSGSGYQWGKSSVGWICLSYTDFDQVKDDSSAESSEEAFDGVICNTSTLNVRSGPGTSNPIVGKLRRGDKVQITKQQKVGSTTWGKMEKGWVSLAYVQKTDAPEQTEPDETKPEETKPEETVPDTGAEKVIATGTVNSKGALRIRAGAGTKYKCLGSLAKGTKVEIYEKTTIGSLTWGRIRQGWICLNYVRLDADQSQSGTGGTGSAAAKMTGVVTKTDKLRIRSGAGVQNAEVGSLARGTFVEILETKKVGSTTWGRISKGWISLYYVKLDTDASIQAAPEKTVTASSLNIRSGAGAGSRCVGSYHQGDKVKILEQTKVGSTLWGRTDRGWICMKYVK